jgi:hypothetical protein
VTVIFRSLVFMPQIWRVTNFASIQFWQLPSLFEPCAILLRIRPKPAPFTKNVKGCGTQKFRSSQRFRDRPFGVVKFGCRILALFARVRRRPPSKSTYFVFARDWLSRFTNRRKAPALPSGS